jgi:hypothetical protein
MNEGFEYVSKNGLLKKNDYSPYHHSKNSCEVSKEELDKKAHMKVIGYVEHDGRTDLELRELLINQPISGAMYTTAGMAQFH